MATPPVVTFQFPAGGYALAPYVDQNFGDLVKYISDRNAATADWDTLSVLGASTFKTAITITPTSNQIVLGATRTWTISAATPATSSRTASIPDIAGDGTFAFLEGTQTFTGAKTFNDLRGTFGADIAAGSHKITGLSAGSANGDSIRFEQNKVVQWVYGTPQTTATTTTSTSFVDTSTTVTITPTSSSNKILVLAFGQLNHSAAGFSGVATIARGSTDLQSGGQGEVNVSSTGASPLVPCGLMVVDSPATTSATTYKVRIKTNSGSGTTGWVNGNAKYGTIIAIEVAP